MTQKWKPDGDVGSAGGWSASTGSDLYAMIDDETPTNSTYIEASDDSMDYSNRVCTVSLENKVTPDDGDIKLYYTAKSSNDNWMGTLSIKLELLGDGSSKANLTQSLTTGFVNYTSSDLIDHDAISDWTTAQVRITMLAGGGMGETIQLSNLYLQTASGSSGGSSKIPVTLFINGMST